MSQIIYTMQFEGEVRPIGTSPNVMKVMTVAQVHMHDSRGTKWVTDYHRAGSWRAGQF